MIYGPKSTQQNLFHDLYRVHRHWHRAGAGTDLGLGRQRSHVEGIGDGFGFVFWFGIDVSREHYLPPKVWFEICR